MNISPKLTADVVSKYVYFTTPRELEGLAETSQGVYGWYAPPPSKVMPPVDEKAYAHYAAICKAAGKESVSGKRYSAEINKNPPPSQSYFVRKLADKQVIELSAIATLFSSPLYVGKACGKEGLKRRLKDEAASASFRRKFLNLAVGNEAMATFNFKNCLIKYVDVSALLCDCFAADNFDVEYLIDDACNFLEQAVFWAAFPPLNKKMGV